jgi:hypothetical protein
MRKITLFIITLMMAGSLFAYEPKKENVTVKRNGDIVYYEKTEPYNYLMAGLEPDKDYVKWVIRKGYTVEQAVDYAYERLDKSRKGYYFLMKKAIDPKPDDSIVAFAKLFNKDPVEWETKTSMRLARGEISWATTCLVFVTEENFLTLTKEEMIAKMYAFISDCTN